MLCPFIKKIKFRISPRTCLVLLFILLLFPAAVSGSASFSAADCTCSGSDLPTLLPQNSGFNPDDSPPNFKCNYYDLIPPSQAVLGTTLTFYIVPFDSSAAAEQTYAVRAREVRALYDQTAPEEKEHYSQYSPPGPDRFSQIITRTTQQLGTEYLGERWLVYRSVYLISIVTADSTDASSQQPTIARMDAAEACAKRIIDRLPLAGSGTAATRVATPAPAARSSVVPGSSGSYETMMNYANPGTSDPSLDDLDGLTSPYEAATTEYPPDESSEGSAALGAVVLLGGAAAVGLVGVKVLGAGATKAAGGAAAGSQAAGGVAVTGPVTGSERSATDVVAAGTAGPTQLERRAAQAGEDSVGRLGGAPLPGDAVSAGPGSSQAPYGAGAPGTTPVSPADPSSEMVSSETSTGNLEEEMPAQQQLVELRGRVDEILKEKIAEGYTVINPDWIRIWHRSIMGMRFFGAPSVYDITEYTGLQAPRGRCGEFAAWGQKWIRESATKIFGEGTYVDMIGLNPDGRFNHAATHITTPQGQKYVVDFWEGVHNGATKVYTEAEWMDKWKDKLGRDVPQYRNTMERDLETMIRNHGEENGLEVFRLKYNANPRQTEAIVSGYKKHPWFRL